MSLSSLIKQIEEAHAQSTQGEYRSIIEHDLHEGPVVVTENNEFVCSTATDVNFGIKDAAFIALAHNTTPRLIAAIKVLREGLIDLKAMGESYTHYTQEAYASGATDVLTQADSIAKGEDK